MITAFTKVTGLLAGFYYTGFRFYRYDTKIITVFQINDSIIQFDFVSQEFLRPCFRPGVPD